MSQISIRKATTADAELLSELGARTFSETFAVDNTPENMAAYLADAFTPEEQLAELSDPNTIIKFAELDGAAVGYSVLSPNRTPPEIDSENAIELVRLYVSQDSIGTGVGARLMKDCLDYAAQLGFETIWLGVWEHNRRAQAFYRKWNFEVVGTHVFQLGDDAQTDLLMKRTMRQ
ncbi:MAG TPA: GNAT family N-acetyltransferase [Pyrinomonadaceae bacterium]